MTVQVLYNGRSGNRLFQYACARLFAEENGLGLATTPPDVPWVPISPAVLVKAPDAPPHRLGDPDRVLEHLWPKGHYLLDGFFQEADWYWKRRDSVLGIYPMPEIPRLPEDHVVVAVRLTDYWHHKIVISPSWYHGILSALRPSTVTVVTDAPKDSYHAVFRPWKPTIVSGEVKDDFELLRSATTLVLSNSTFAWWAAFLGRPKKVYTFLPWIANPAANLCRFPGAVAVDGKFAG